jgi:hypothetical protein
MATPQTNAEPRPRPSRPDAEKKKATDPASLVDATPAWFSGIDAAVWNMSIEEWQALLEERYANGALELADEAKQQTAEAREERIEDEVDEAIDESFPASDPPSYNAKRKS